MSRPPQLVLRALSCAVPLALLVVILTTIPLGFATDDVQVGSQVVFSVVVMSFPLTGAVIVWFQPDNRIGWLLEGIGLVWAVGGLTDNYATYGLLVAPGSLPGADVAAAVNQGIWAPALGLTGTLLILLFPDGHVPSPGWRWVARFSSATVAALYLTMLVFPGKMELGPDPTRRNPLGLESAETLIKLLMSVLLVLFPVSVMACVAGLVVRFRRSRGTERLQLKWLAAAAAFVGATFPLSMLAPSVVRALTGSPQSSQWMGVLDSLSLLSFALFPAAIGAAILRHRLYDIDLVIKRTLLYACLTASLAAVYLSSVLLLQLLLSPLTEQSQLAVAGSTLLVAVLFRPVRGSMQASIDRRFNRRRYDAAGTLEIFAARVRDEVDVDAVGAELGAVVSETLQPSAVQLWIRS